MGQKKRYYSISFSGGKDSTALTLEWLKRHICNHVEYPLDEVLYCDTWKEFPSMVDHIAQIEKLVLSAGIKFTRIQSDKSFDYYLYEHQFTKRTKKHIYKDVDLVGYGWAGSRSRWCTSKLKQDVINKYFKSLEEEYEVIHLIGLAADEQYRLERPGNQKADHLHPLVEWGWTEADCLSYCYNLGYDWGGLYQIFDRVSCWCCPLQPLEDLRKLRKYFPDLWQELREMDKKTWRVFNGYRTVEDLEKRFALEDVYIREGKSIRSRAFYAEYNRIAPPLPPESGVMKLEISKQGG